VQEIAAASKEQDAGAEQINGSIQQLDKVIQQNSASSEEMASTTEVLSAQAGQLQDVVAFFVVDEAARKELHFESPEPVVMPNQQALPDAQKTEDRLDKGETAHGDDIDNEFEKF
jgi:methyl-accepting chemotaxis protein